MLTKLKQIFISKTSKACGKGAKCRCSGYRAEGQISGGEMYIEGDNDFGRNSV